MLPDDIVYMMKRPGRYAVSVDRMLTYSFVEVDDRGLIHQLMPDAMTRDGILVPERWRYDVRVYTFSADRKTFVRIGYVPPENAT